MVSITRRRCGNVMNIRLYPKNIIVAHISGDERPFSCLGHCLLSNMFQLAAVKLAELLASLYSVHSSNIPDDSFGRDGILTKISLGCFMWEGIWCGWEDKELLLDIEIKFNECQFSFIIRRKTIREKPDCLILSW